MYQASTVLSVKQEFERETGISARQMHVFVHDKSREEELGNEETLLSLRPVKSVVGMSLLVQQADAQQVVPALTAEPEAVMGDGTYGGLNNPSSVAFLPAHPDWIAVTEFEGHCIKISNIRTGMLICKYDGGNEQRLNGPWGVAVTSDSSFVLVADFGNHRVQLLRLVVGVDRKSAQLNFERSLEQGRTCMAKYGFLLM
jgi:hypothetical protein